MSDDAEPTNEKIYGVTGIPELRKRFLNESAGDQRISYRVEKARDAMWVAR